MLIETITKRILGTSNQEQINWIIDRLLFNIKWAEVYVCVLNMFINTKSVETGLSLWVNILIAIINRIETCSGEGRYILPWKRPQTTPPNKTWTSIRPAASFHLGVGNLTPPQKKMGHWHASCPYVGRFVFDSPVLFEELHIFYRGPIWGGAHILPTVLFEEVHIFYRRS